ncbi:MAG: hypothetical protein A2Y10_16965 [Planctomycetes bacterium GWF2_41_51]|nr:MAG: hypothetical protein A2Y10_16965 [Planctomycetes bacterium GWF2_41_51]HBG28078.1 hypothetical protein [Phycisphaerales bacterium]
MFNINKYKMASLVMLIVSLALSTVSFGWSGVTWGNMEREEIVRIADDMIDVSWRPLNNIYNYRSPSGGYTWFYSNTTYYGVAYMMNNPVDDLAEFLAHVNTTPGGTTYYGNDCSAFVSMCWKMTQRHTTSSIEGATSYVTLLGSDGQCDDVSLIIGDACNDNGSHIILFDYYSGSGGMYSMEQTPATATRRYWSWSSLASYRPLRRKNLVDYSQYDGPAACSMNSGRIDVVSRGSAGQVKLRTWTSGGGWTTGSLGGVTNQSPTIVSRTNGILDAFCASTDGILHQNHYENGNWSGWQNLGQTLASGPAACSQNSTNITIAARGVGNNNVWVRNWNSSSGWGSWVNLGGITYHSPCIVSRASGTLDVFIRDGNGYLQQNSSYNGGSTWSGWASYGFIIGSSPAGLSRSSSNVELFYRQSFVYGNGNNLMGYYWNGATGWAVAGHGGQMVGVPSVAKRDSNTMDVFVRGLDGNLYQLGWTAAGGWWTGFYNMGAY